MGKEVGRKRRAGTYLPILFKLPYVANLMWNIPEKSIKLVKFG